VLHSEGATGKPAAQNRGQIFKNLIVIISVTVRARGLNFLCR